MITIRKAQMDAFTSYMRKSFELSSVAYLKKKYPEATRDKNEEEMLRFVKEGIEKADRYDIIERNDVLPFLEYMICYGNDFETNPANGWATEVFKIDNLSGEERIKRLLNEKPL